MLRDYIYTISSRMLKDYIELVLLPHFVMYMQACNHVLINNCRLLTVFQVKFKRPFKVIHFLIKISSNQSILNGTLVIKKVTNTSATHHH